MVCVCADEWMNPAAAGDPDSLLSCQEPCPELWHCKVCVSRKVSVREDSTTGCEMKGSHPVHAPHDGAGRIKTDKLTLMDSSSPPWACPFSARPSSSTPGVSPSMLWERLCSSSWRASSSAARVRSYANNTALIQPAADQSGSRFPSIQGRKNR